VVQETAVGVERAAPLKGDGVHPSALVGQLDAFAFTEGSAPTGSSHRLRGAGANTGLGCRGGFVDGSFAAHDIPRSCKTVVPHVVVSEGVKLWRRQCCRQVTLPVPALPAPIRPRAPAGNGGQHRVLREQPSHLAVVVHNRVVPAFKL
jgi:hypothetical protein